MIHMLPYQISAINIQKKRSYKNNKFKISAPTWNDKFELPGRSYYVISIQDYFNYIIKKHETGTDNPPTMYVCNQNKKHNNT